MVALPKAETLTLALPTDSPDTATDAIPTALVSTEAEGMPRMAGSVDANVTGTLAMAAPLTDFTVAVSVLAAPPTIKATVPETPAVSEAPVMLICVVAGAAVQPLQLAVITDERLVWSAALAITVKEAPAAVVTTDCAASTTPLVADKVSVAPFTEALPLLSARTVRVAIAVPSAFSVGTLDEMTMDATDVFTPGVAVVVVVVVVAVVEEVVVAVEPAGVPALPPPPPQPARVKVANKNASASRFFIFVPCPD